MLEVDRRWKFEGLMVGGYDEMIGLGWICTIIIWTCGGSNCWRMRANKRIRIMNEGRSFFERVGRGLRLSFLAVRSVGVKQTKMI